MDTSQYSACVSQCDAQDGGATLNAVNGEDCLYQIVGYHKGSAFPTTPRLTLKQWEEAKKVMDLAMVSALRRGTTLKDLGDTMMKELDELEAGLVRVQAIGAQSGRSYTTGKWWHEEGEALYEDIMGKTASECHAMWFGNIHALLKMKRIEDGEMEGWSIIPAWMLALTNAFHAC